MRWCVRDGRTVGVPAEEGACLATEVAGAFVGLGELGDADSDTPALDAYVLGIPNGDVNGVFYFVSRRPGGCGQGDIYVSRLRDHGEFDAPEMLPCDDTYPHEAVNSPYDEFSPFPLPETGSGPLMPGTSSAWPNMPPCDALRYTSLSPAPVGLSAFTPPGRKLEK